MHAISSYRGNRPTKTHTIVQTNTAQIHKQDRLQYTAPLNLERSVTKTKILLDRQTGPLGPCKDIEWRHYRIKKTIYRKRRTLTTAMTTHVLL